MSVVISSIHEERYTALSCGRGEILIQRGQGKTVSLSQFEIAAIVRRQSIFPGQKTAGVERHEIGRLDFDGKRQNELYSPCCICWGHAPFPLGQHQDVGHFDDPEREDEGLSLVEEQEDTIRLLTRLILQAPCGRNRAIEDEAVQKRLPSRSMDWMDSVPDRVRSRSAFSSSIISDTSATCLTCGAVSSATGTPRRVMITRSPRRARSSNCDSLALASMVLTVRGMVVSLQSCGRAAKLAGESIEP